MSGGVDSSTAAALLKKDGYDVIGVRMMVAGDLPAEEAESLRDVLDARAVAEKLGFPFHVVDLRDAFARQVIAPFADEYARGRTPNPCAVCNRRIKFGLLAEKARELGAELMATGHHARIVSRGGRNMVARGRDSMKDQSYFLFTLTHEDLERIRFPVGDYTKKHVRRMASEMGLAISDKVESNEVCFVPDDDYSAMVEKYAGKVPPPGEIVLGDGRVVGKHRGIHKFTVGQRRGLGVALGEPVYVLALDAANNRVVVGPVSECRSEGLVATGVVWNYYNPPEEGQAVEVGIRYRNPPIKGRLYPLGEDKIKVIFTGGAGLVTPGQAAVFYEDDIVLGGGWIEESLR